MTKGSARPQAAIQGLAARIHVTMRGKALLDLHRRDGWNTDGHGPRITACSKVICGLQWTI
jgi:hypothetical protein